MRHLLRLTPRTRSVSLLLWMALLMIGSLAGCAAIAMFAQDLPKAAVPAKYKGFKDQSVAVMVWADRGIQVDWPQIQLDCANGIQSKLMRSRQGKSSELSGSMFPKSAATVVRFQEEHPEWSADSIEEIAPRLGVSRVIYVEIDGFQTRSDSSVDLFRGTITGTVRVIEVTSGKARVVFTEDNLRVVFPKNSPEEGVPSLGDFDTYRQTVDAFTTTVHDLFVSHPPPEE